jgi:transcriptional regulator with XRE-family HTH domain
MLSFPDIKTAKDVTARIREFFQLLRHSSKATGFVFAALLAAGVAYWLAQTDQAKQVGGLIFKDDWPKISGYTSLALFVLAGLLFTWACFLVWKELIPPPESQDAVRPTALKGPMAFGPHDAELFRRLGREDEIATLLDWILNEQIGLIIVMGESGAGKTSLLRAGLPGLLAKQDPPIEYHYWEAVPDRPAAGLLAAVQTGWATTADMTAPQKLSDLYIPSQHGARRVVVLDQFEQLGPSKSQLQPIFQLIKNVAITAMPPHRITYIVVFRRDYAPTWLDFQQDQLAGRPLTMMSLRLFNETQAKEIMAVITEAAKFTVDNGLVDDLIARMKNDEDRISPVDIGITLLALNERARANPDSHLAKGDYQIGGGATGLLAEYVSSRLDRYRPDERSNILKIMLALADLGIAGLVGNDRRLAQGLLPDQLADKVGLPVKTVRGYLRDLASPQVRLLELLSPSDAYRLSHERLIPALRQLSGLVLAEAEQTSLMFNRVYADWVAGQRSRMLLLGGRRLSDVVKYRAQLYWGTDRDDKETFLERSLTWRGWRRTIATALAAALFAIGYFGWEQFSVWQYKRDLTAWRLPTALYDQSGQLISLDATSGELTHLRWLRCGFNELVLIIPKVDDIEDLRGCKTLRSLTLVLTSRSGASSSVSNLDALKELKGLTTLTLELGASSVSNLDALKELKGLTTLTLSLNGSSVSNLDALKELKGLTNLTLDPRGSSVSNLDALKELKGLTTLTLDLAVLAGAGSSSVSNLDALKELKGLTTLTLDLSASGRVNRVSNLDALKELKGLTTLTLDLAGSSVSNLDALKELKGLTTLTLNLDASRVREPAAEICTGR